MSAALLSHPLDQGHPPEWASEWGDDRRGVFVAFEVNGCVVRFRWIPPGRFLRGSPESDSGRFDNEGPQHEVTLTEGYWLAEAPCTQALWQAVTGENPSEFRSPRRPVEQVSWNDCQDFLRALNERVRGLEARLPTEAEWERACRAGTTTSTYAGELEILGGNNAPLLHDIAWYGGNSGLDFDLDNGWDSSSWLEKQFEHSKAGTREVRQKAPNGWGLYDMLGNVWEWCADWHGEYSGGPLIDPRGPDKGSARVVRGGSWFTDAWRVRCAARDAIPPADRGDSVGFRLARGQVRGA